MFTLELNLKTSPAPITLMLKDEQTAQQQLQTLVKAVQTRDPQWLSLTCDKTQKQVWVCVAEVAAVQLTPKQGGSGAATVRTGFAVQLETAS
ncbi:MAG: hypothetical protein Q6J68_06015 [Thermostichales cyanobacterium SZTDM-1c_bins_54]